MPITYTGRSVKPDGATHPSLIDIAVGLSRQPRFAGQGKRWFSVLDHSLFCDELVKRANPAFPANHDTYDESVENLRLAVLLHDAHEAITADVPTDFKSPTLKLYQENLDAAIYGAFSTLPGSYMAPTIKYIDRRALQAEAQVIGPPVEKERIISAFGSSDDLYDDVQLLEELLYGESFGEPPYTYEQETHPGVKEYLSRILGLL